MLYNLRSYININYSHHPLMLNFFLDIPVSLMYREGHACWDVCGGRRLSCDWANTKRDGKMKKDFGGGREAATARSILETKPCLLPVLKKPLSGSSTIRFLSPQGSQCLVSSAEWHPGSPDLCRLAHHSTDCVGLLSARSATADLFWDGSSCWQPDLELAVYTRLAQNSWSSCLSLCPIPQCWDHHTSSFELFMAWLAIGQNQN